MEVFNKDITMICNEILQGEQELEKLVMLYNCGLRGLMDKHAPIRTVRKKGDKPNPWYCDEIVEARNRRRKCENTWRHTGLEVHRQMYIAARNDSTKLISEKR